jgi:hypothetical protein
VLTSLPLIVPGLEGEEGALREARRLLEDPAQIDTILTQPEPLLSPVEVENLQAMLAAEHAQSPDGVRVAAAHVALLLQRMREHGATDPTSPRRQRFRLQARAHLEDLARRSPSLALAPLEAVAHLWGGAGRAELPDLLAVPWPGALYELLDAIRTGAPPPSEENAAALRQLGPIGRLEKEVATSSSAPNGGRGGE